MPHAGRPGLLALSLAIIPITGVTQAARGGYGACPAPPPDPAFEALVAEASGSVNATFDPDIQEIIAQINADSIQATIERLVKFGTRFTYSDSLVEAEEWIAERFRSYGGYDPVFHRVNFRGTPRHNIYAELEGSADEEEWIVVGGHHDSINWTDDPSTSNPYSAAPGADDNASGSSAVMEMARVMAGAELPPTLRFTTFTIEELGLVGSNRMARDMRNNQQTVRMMINLDMVAHDPLNEDRISVSGSDIAETQLVRSMVDIYSNHTWTAAGWAANSDHYSFSSNGHPAINFIEDNFNFGGWHHSSDRLERLDMNYCAEVARVALATALTVAIYPAPVSWVRVTDPGGGNSLVAQWPSSEQATGYRVRWGSEPGAPTHTMDVSDTTTVISGLTPNEMVYVSVVAIDPGGHESWWAPEVGDAPITFEGGILLVDETTGGLPAESIQDSLFGVYLSGFDYEELDLALAGALSIADLGGHSVVIWVGEDLPSVEFPEHVELLFDYVTRGGNLLSSGWTQIGYLAGGIPGDFAPGSFGHDVLGIERVTRSEHPDFMGATSLLPGYSSLQVSERFWPDGPLPLAEAFEPAEDATALLSFESASADTAFQGRPVGIRNPGPSGSGDTYTLGIPLLLMEPEGARAWFIQTLDELGIPVGIRGPTDSPPNLVGSGLQISPNPFNPRTTITFDLASAGPARVSVLDLAGRRIATLLDRPLDPGRHRIGWDGTTVHGRRAASAIYVVLLETRQGRWTERIVLLK